MEIIRVENDVNSLYAKVIYLEDNKENERFLRKQ
jgi:hypothetical protein